MRMYSVCICMYRMYDMSHIRVHDIENIHTGNTMYVLRFCVCAYILVNT